MPYLELENHKRDFAQNFREELLLCCLPILNVLSNLNFFLSSLNTFRFFLLMGNGASLHCMEHAPVQPRSHMHTYMHSHAHACTPHTCAFMRRYTRQAPSRVSTLTYAHTHALLRTNTHTHTHTHTHTQTCANIYSPHTRMYSPRHTCNHVHTRTSVHAFINL